MRGRSSDILFNLGVLLLPLAVATTLPLHKPGEPFGVPLGGLGEVGGLGESQRPGHLETGGVKLEARASLVGYGATDSFALDCRGDDVDVGLFEGAPAFIQGSFWICSSVGLSCGLKESIRRIRDFASTIRESKKS